jgi:plastocyanin
MMSEPDARAGRGRWLLVALVAAPAIVLVVAALVGLVRSERIIVEVPAGAASRLEAGEDLALLPRTLEVSVGDTLEIRNLDDVTHEVGPYVVGAGQTLTQTFTAPGTIQGLCSLHPSGEITIVVR